MEQIIISEKKAILEQIANSNYPPGHPFLTPTFENDFLLNILVLLKILCGQVAMVDDYISEKLKSHNEGVFCIEKYFQNVNEVTFLYYLFTSLICTENTSLLKSLDYEPSIGAVGNKKFEYSFKQPTDGKIINFEVKTVTCDPVIKEDGFYAKDGDKFIKTFFPNDDISKYCKNLSEYRLMEKSSLYRQIRSAIKKIDSKFKKDKNHINVGVIVGQFATSLDEFYAYFLNSKKGLIFKNKAFLKNIDALVYFSLSTGPDPMMTDIYESGHTFTILFNNDINIKEILSKFRLDNFAYSNGKILESLKRYTEKTHGRYIFKNINGIVFFIEEGTENNELDNYVKLLIERGIMQ